MLDNNWFTKNAHHRLAIRRKYAAEMYSCPPEILEYLAKDKSFHVRKTVARHRNTPESALELLSRDSNIDVLMAVIYNVNSPIHVLEFLSQHEKYAVRYHVTRQYRCSEEIRVAFALEN